MCEQDSMISMTLEQCAYERLGRTRFTDRYRVHSDDRAGIAARWIVAKALPNMFSIIGLAASSPPEPHEHCRGEQEKRRVVRDPRDRHGPSCRSASSTSPTLGLAPIPPTFSARGQPCNPVAAGSVEM